MNDFLSTASHMPTHNTAEPTTYVRLIKVRINEYTSSLGSMPMYWKNFDFWYTNWGVHV